MGSRRLKFEEVRAALLEEIVALREEKESLNKTMEALLKKKEALLEERAALCEDNSILGCSWTRDEEQWQEESRLWEKEWERRDQEMCELTEELTREKENIVQDRAMLQEEQANCELEMAEEGENCKKDMEAMEKTLNRPEDYHDVERSGLELQVMELRRTDGLFSQHKETVEKKAKRKRKSAFLSWLKGRKQVTKGEKSVEEESAEQSALTEKEVATVVRAPVMKDRKKEKMEKGKHSDGTMEQEQGMDEEQQKKKKSAFSFRQMWKKWTSRGKITPEEERAEKRALTEMEKSREEGMEGIMEKEYNSFLTNDEDSDKSVETETQYSPVSVEEESVAEEKESGKEVVQENQDKKQKRFRSWFQRK